MRTTLGEMQINTSLVRYLHFGEGEKVMVVLPGTSLVPVTDSGEAVCAAFSDFTKQYNIYLFEVMIDPDHRIEDMADDVANAMKKLELSGAFVYGVSQGGMIGLALAIRHPELVERIVVASTLSRPTEISERTLQKWEALAAEKDIPSVNQAMAGDIYSLEFLEQFKEAFEASKETGTPEQAEQLRRKVRACRNFDCYEELPKIKAPIFVMGAEKDQVTGVEGSKEIIELLSCEFFIYPGYSHAVYDEAPDFRNRVKAFFEAED